MHRSLFAAVLTLALLSLSCAREPLTQTGLKGEATLAAVRELVSSYERREIEPFMERVGGSYPERETFRTRAADMLSTYQTINCRFQYERMFIEVQHRGNIRATVTWEGEWKTAGGRILTDGARSTFILDPGTYRLLGIEGKNPFVPTATPMPVRQ